jgi:hypothetical protein
MFFPSFPTSNLLLLIIVPMVVVKRQRTYRISSDAGGRGLRHGYDEGQNYQPTQGWVIKN